VNRPGSALLRVARTRPLLIAAASVALLVFALLPADLGPRTVTRWLVAWNTGAVFYVVLAAVMMTRSSEQQMRQRAQRQDDGQLVILALVAAATLASLAAIARELAVVRDLHGVLRGAHVALAGTTVLSSWAFIQVMFALHYAHDYYAAEGRGEQPGLQFPGEQEPGYGDFFYFAAVIGTSGQTADVAIVTKPMRRIGSLHCILAYLFNTTVLALLINIGAGMF